jgi:hypothetical protein
LSKYEISDHISKHGFMSNYPVWHRHGEVQAPTTIESDRSNDNDRMNDIISDNGMEYDLGSGDQHPPLEVQNFYRLLIVSKKSAR